MHTPLKRNTSALQCRHLECCYNGWACNKHCHDDHTDDDLLVVPGLSVPVLDYEPRTYESETDLAVFTTIMKEYNLTLEQLYAEYFPPAFTDIIPLRDVSCRYCEKEHLAP